MRKKRQLQVKTSAPRPRRRARSQRGPRKTPLAIVLALGLLLVACLAPSGQARPLSTGTPEEQAAAQAQETAVRDAAHEALREERAAARKALNEAKWATGGERPNVVVKTTCTQVIWEWRNFRDLPGNEVKLKTKINLVNKYSTYTFDGPSSTQVMPINAPPGHYKIDTRAYWRTNGLNGHFDIGVSANCKPNPGFSLEKLQRIEGTKGEYTSAPLKGEVGHTVDYEVLVHNTGNVPLTFGALQDPRCDAGTITGGPPGGTLAVEATAAYLCTHLVTEADFAAGSVTNTVTLTGTPPPGEGSPVEHPSNTVVVEPVSPGTLPPEEPPVTPGATTPSSGVLASSTSSTPTSGVLATKSAVPALRVSAPGLKGPQGCVRSSARASVKSKGVSSVAFYMDGHKLRTMTAKTARHGLISITIDPTKMSYGAHHLLAKITMAKTSSSSKPVRATRSATVIRCRPAVLTPKFTG